MTRRLDILSQTSAEELIRGTSQVTENHSLIVWDQEWSERAIPELKARITGYISGSLPEFGRLPGEVVVGEDQALRKKEFQRETGLALCHAEILEEGEIIDIGSCEPGKPYTLRYQKLNPTYMKKLAGHVYKVGVDKEGTMESFRFRRAHHNDDFAEMIQEYTGGAVYKNGSRLMNPDQVEPEDTIKWIRDRNWGGRKGGVKGPSKFAQYPTTQLEVEEEWEDEALEVKFTDGYIVYHAEMRKTWPKVRAAQRIRSYVGRYVDEEKIRTSAGPWNGRLSGGATLLFPAGQEVQIKFRKQEFKVEISLEKFAKGCINRGEVTAKE
jgi:hypothetical protein